jgi:hypothetical protein
MTENPDLDFLKDMSPDEWGSFITKVATYNASPAGELKRNIKGWWNRPGLFYLGESSSMPVVRLMQQDHPGWNGDRRGSYEEYLEVKESYLKRLPRESQYLGITYQSERSVSWRLGNWVIRHGGDPECYSAGSFIRSDPSKFMFVKMPTGQEPHGQISGILFDSNFNRKYTPTLIFVLNQLLEDPGIVNLE